jgi:MoxR-like ATPase
MTMPPKPDYQYTGDDAYQPPYIEEGVTDPQGRRYFPYIPSPDLKEAVNLAIALKRPLLLEGEPGCGKTRLAGAIAYEFAKKNLPNSVDIQGNLQAPWEYYIWTVKSTLRARDGLYTFDAVGRLRDAQLVGLGSDPQRLQDYLGQEESDRLKARLKEKKKYRDFGPLGNALQAPTYRPIVLIDEIDKADNDFPNDLLLELDQLCFEIPETEEKFPTPGDHQKPIILITSNREKPLPEPFLRRCLYFYVGFPEREQLEDIIRKRFGQPKRGQEKLISDAVTHFYAVRDLLKKQPGSRPPGTSEILEFLTALKNMPVKQAKADLENLADRLPLLGTLLKTKSDQDLYRQTFSGKRNG